jgi:hypothetical protein
VDHLEGLEALTELNLRKNLVSKYPHPATSCSTP